MKKFFLFFVLLLILAGDLEAQKGFKRDATRSFLSIPSITFTTRDSWFSRDKAHHFLTSAFLASTGYYVSRQLSQSSDNRSQIAGIGFSLSLGILKEINDGLKQQNNFSWKDLVADCLGTGLGILLMKD